MKIVGNKVRFEKDGNLYVEYKNTVLIFKNPFDYVPDGVELVRVENELYIKGCEPKPQEFKKESKKENK